MKWKSKSTYKLIGIIIALILLVIFTLQNSVTVPVKIFLWTFPLSSALLIIISLIIGFLAGFLGFKIVTKKSEKS